MTDKKQEASAVPKRYVVTGTPGAGKTSLLHGLQKRVWSVVEEAATDVIARAQAVGRDDPWSDGGFTSKIAVLQSSRSGRGSPRGSAAVTGHRR